jgi:3-oxoacyl-(acyl-carrier-protein) synthase
VNKRRQIAMTRQRDDEQRVVVSGMGIITPIGENLEEYCQSLKAGRSGITRWKKMTDRIESKIGGDMSDFDLQAHFARVGTGYPAEFVERAYKLLRTTPLSGRLSAAAVLQASLDAGLPHPNLNPERIGHILGGTNLNLHYIFDNVLELVDEPDYIEPLFGLFSLDTDVLAVASELVGLKGPSFTTGGACASGNLALLSGLDLIRSGRADAVIVTGGAIDLDPVILQGWAKIEAISVQSFNADPPRASRPFDARREGFVPSHGAGAVVLESLASARARGVPIHAELLGASATSDSSRLTKPHVEGQIRALRNAIQDAQIEPSQVDYINAHATSTPLGDAAEVSAIKAVFGEHAYHIPVNSTKSLVGHCVMAAAMVEFIATVLQIENGFVHPTINQEEKDPQLDLDFVPNVAREQRINIAVSNSFGFGGFDACVVVRQAP